MVLIDFERAKQRISELETEILLSKRSASSPTMLSAIKKISANWTSTDNMPNIAQDPPSIGGTWDAMEPVVQVDDVKAVESCKNTRKWRKRSNS